MPSQFVWKSYGRFTRWSERLWSSPITFLEERREFKGTKELTLLIPWYISSGMVLATGVLMLLLLLRTLFSPHSTNISILEFVFILFYISTAMFILVLMHFSIILRQQILLALNQLLTLDKTLNRWGFLDADGMDSVGIFMHGFLLISNIIPVLLSVFGVYENVDVLFLFLVRLIPQCELESSIALTLLRFFWSLIAVLEIWKEIGFNCLSCLLALQIVSKAITIKTKSARLMKFSSKPRHRLQLQWKFTKAYEIYRRLQLIIFGGINPTMIYFIPYFMGLGLLLNILCDFTTISLHSEMNSLLLCVMPGISFAVKFIILTLLPQACTVNDESLKFINDWSRVAPIRNKLSRRKLRALVPLRFYAGMFFYYKRSTKMTYLSVIMYYTVTAVISIKRQEE